MKIAAKDLLDLMLDAGMEPKFVNGLNCDASLKDQGFESVYCPIVHAAIKEKYGYEIPLEDCPVLLSVNQLAAYLESKVH